MDERRIVKLSECYRGFAEAERRVVPIINKCLEGMISAAKSVDDRKVCIVDNCKENMSNDYHHSASLIFKSQFTQFYSQAITEYKDWETGWEMRVLE